MAKRRSTISRNKLATPIARLHSLYPEIDGVGRLVLGSSPQNSDDAAILSYHLWEAMDYFNIVAKRPQIDLDLICAAAHSLMAWHMDKCPEIRKSIAHTD